MLRALIRWLRKRFSGRVFLESREWKIKRELYLFERRHKRRK
jgi:hypothetical protein